MSLIAVGQLENFHLTSDQLDTDGVERKLAMQLLDIYWSRLNSATLIVYRPAFTKSWRGDGMYFSKLLLNAMFLGASRFMPDRDVLGDRFRTRFKQLLAPVYDRSKVTTLQGLLIVSISLSAIGKDRSLIWLYSGLAHRMLIDLGLHTQNTALGPAEEDVEIARRIFWAAFGEYLRPC